MLTAMNGRDFRNFMGAFLAFARKALFNFPLRRDPVLGPRVRPSGLGNSPPPLLHHQLDPSPGDLDSLRLAPGVPAPAVAVRAAKVKASNVLDPALDPRGRLDYAYQKAAVDPGVNR
jgi:hypothetical protein